MPTELEELVGFLGSPQPQIRQLALENVVGYSQGPQTAIFKANGLAAVKNLKVIVSDIPPRAKHALTILVNLSQDADVRTELLRDNTFLEVLLSKLTDATYTNADLAAMLLANLSKDDAIGKLVGLKRGIPKGVSSSALAMDQLMDCFVKGAGRTLNKEANFDYLAYVFADISRLPLGRSYFVTRQQYDDVIPISKLVVFTEHKSVIRRKGVAQTIKNCCFDIPFHSTFLDLAQINILPYLLLPICGPEEFSEEDMDGMPEDLQLLPPDKTREPDILTLMTHIESLLLLTTTRAGREQMRTSKVYPIIRETHLHVEDDDITDVCDRLVQVLMRDEVPEGEVKNPEEVEEDEDYDEDDDKVIEII